MNALVIRAWERHIAAPLVGNHPLVHYSADNAEHFIVKEKFCSEAWPRKGHGKKVAMRAAIRLVAVSLEIVEKKRPKRNAASLDRGPREMLFEHAIALVLDLDDLVLNPYQRAPLPVSSPSDWFDIMGIPLGSVTNSTIEPQSEEIAIYAAHKMGCRGTILADLGHEQSSSDMGFARRGTNGGYTFACARFCETHDFRD